MLCCVMLCCVVLYCVVLCCVVLCCVVLYCILLCCDGGWDGGWDVPDYGDVGVCYLQSLRREEERRGEWPQDGPV